MSKQFPLADILVVNSSYSRKALKQRLLQEGLLSNSCFRCGLDPIWWNESLVLIIDHINGINNDNRLENLRLVCPNCNSQLSTFSGRNRKIKLAPRFCTDCGTSVTKVKGTLRCKPCNGKWVGSKTRVIDWPSLSELEERIAHTNRSKVAREFGVSESAIRKMVKRMRASSIMGS
jgi:Zn finger protein HypA/HybF involved in hydrogenase expression